MIVVPNYGKMLICEKHTFATGTMSPRKGIEIKGIISYLFNSQQNKT